MERETLDKKIKVIEITKLLSTIRHISLISKYV